MEKHHFFGFHDLMITNYNDDKILALAIKDISRPPYAGDKVTVGYYNKKQVFTPIKDIEAWNYPQGARQQWIGDTDKIVFNDRVNDKWGSHIADTTTNQIIQTNSFPIHCLNEKTGDAFYLNYSRVHSNGGYGYIGVLDKNASIDIPKECGLFIGNINDQTTKLLVSLEEIASCGEHNPIVTGYPHYITHLCLNPSKTRICFLHRYRLADGGENTRLMSVNADGTDLRLLLKGFLSHFTWVNDLEIFIWGQKSSSVSNFRESKLYNNKIIAFGIGILKKVLKRFLSRSVNAINNVTFLLVNDSDTPDVRAIGVDKLKEDGHPMLCPKNNEWLVNDTYPNKDGIRTLMLYNYLTNKKIELGKYKMTDARPNLTTFSKERVQEGIDARIIEKFPVELYCFTRSGYHCDLHPRWSSDGNTVYFDSIHEGKRQIYAIDVAHLIKK